MKTIIINVPEILTIIISYYLLWILLHYLIDKIQDPTYKFKQLRNFHPFRDFKIDTIGSYFLFAIITTMIYTLLYFLISVLLSYNYIFEF